MGMLALLAGQASAEPTYQVHYFELHAPPSPMPHEPHFWMETEVFPAGLHLEESVGAASGGAIAGHMMSIKNFRPVLWTEGEGVSLIPDREVEPEADFGSVRGIGGGQQVGWIGGAHRAALWSGSSDSYVRLHPDGPVFGHSWANGTNGRFQVGQIGEVGVGNQAVRWEGSADSMLRLPTPGLFAGEGRATTDEQAVGTAFDSEMRMHAVLWSVAESRVTFTDLHSANYFHTQAHALGAVQQVGFGTFENVFFDGPVRALLWQGSADSLVDLHPEAYYSSVAAGTNDHAQVGFVQPHPGGWDARRAAFWAGSADSFVDLHAHLEGEFMASQAISIDADGVIHGMGLRPNGNGHPMWHAVVWTPVAANCPADFNADGQLNFFDLSAYLNAFTSESPDADLAAPFGAWNFFDVSAYLALFNQGCP